MFGVITKTELWQWISAGHVADPKLGLKAVQDAFVRSHLALAKGRRILEVGGGESRILRELAGANECWNAEKIEQPSTGRVRLDIKRLANVRSVECYMGDFSRELPDKYFDAVFSISVVEHVPSDRFVAFLRDCVRVLKPGGLMLHAIDVYLFDPGSNIPPARNLRKRIRAYLDALSAPDLGVRYLQAPEIDESVTASARWASNPDTVLYSWNKIVPALTHVRANAQSASLKLALRTE